MGVVTLRVVGSQVLLVQNGFYLVPCFKLSPRQVFSKYETNLFRDLL